MGEVQAVLFHWQVNMLVWSTEDNSIRNEDLEVISEVWGEDKSGIVDTKS